MKNGSLLVVIAIVFAFSSATLATEAPSPEKRAERRTKAAEQVQAAKQAKTEQAAASSAAKPKALSSTLNAETNKCIVACDNGYETQTGSVQSEDGTVSCSTDMANDACSKT